MEEELPPSSEESLNPSVSEVQMRALAVHRDAQALVNARPGSRSSAAHQKESLSQRCLRLWRTARHVVIAAGVTTAVVFCGGIILVVFRARPSELNTQLADLEAVGSGQVRQALTNLRTQSSNADFIASLAILSESNDPLAHEALVKSGLGVSSREDLNAVEQAIINRVKRLGFIVTATEAALWFNNLPTEIETVPPGFEHVLRFLDPTAPPKARAQQLLQVGHHYSDFMVRLYLATLLDSENSIGFEDILSPVFGNVYSPEELQERSPLALAFGYPQYGSLLISQRAPKLSLLSHADTKWLIARSLQESSTDLQTVIVSSIDHVDWSAADKILIGILKSTQTMPSEVIRVIGKIVMRSVSPADTGIVSRWIDGNSERVLYAVQLLPLGDDVKQEAFDYLVGKSLINEPSASLIAWLRHSAWERRYSFAPFLADLAFPDLISYEQLRSDASPFEPYVADKKLAELFLDERFPQLTRLAVDRFASSLGIPSLLRLLEHDDPTVRIAAIKQLGGVNDVSLLNIIIAKYEREIDSDVKEAYKAQFWVLKNR